MKEYLEKPARLTPGKVDEKTSIMKATMLLNLEKVYTTVNLRLAKEIVVKRNPLDESIK